MFLPNTFDAVKADFGRLYDKEKYPDNIFVGAIRQDNSITFDEEGMSGAAVTIIESFGSSFPKE